MHGIPFKSLLTYVTPHAGVLLLAVLLLLGESAVALANPWIAGRFTDMVLGSPAPTRSGFLALLGIWGLLLTAQSAFAFANRYLLGGASESLLANLRTRLYDHLQALPLGYYHDKRRGEVLALLGNDVAQVSGFVTGTLVTLLPLLVTFAGAFILLLRISPSIAAVAGVLVPLFYLATRLLGRRLRPLSSEWVRTHAEVFANLDENIGMLPAIKSFSREEIESERVRRSNLRLMRVARRRLLVQSLLTPSVHLLAGLGLLLLLYLSAAQVQGGALKPSEMVSLLLYGMLLTRPVSGLAGVYGSVQAARGAAERLTEVFGVAPEPDDAGAPPVGPLAGGIRLEKVHFSYPGRPEVLAGADLDIRPGETVAITGENGSGKSTLVHLLMRFSDPGGGRILMDGNEIRNVSISSLRGQIGLVAQHVLLLNGTVRDNIGFGRAGASDAEIESAARAAQADAFIRRLPQGYGTSIGDQGVRLSGGQRQRIALARALLKDPPILILDEATAMFDPEAERAFVRDCEDALKNRTVILITHRPASLALADRVLLLRDGGIVESPESST
jgi:ABC-type multidrug transport system fused ATPase/permease subunit